MGLFDSILGSPGGNTDASGAAPTIIGILGGLLTQCGGLQGLANRFSQSGHGNVFSSWVGTGANQPISGDQIQRVLGSEQVSALAAKIGVDPAQVSHLLAEFLPKVVDGLTPDGKMETATNHQQSLVDLLPSLMQSLGGKPPAAG
jgi:uncharacterized protein YidB (DUF937 family)